VVREYHVKIEFLQSFDIGVDSGWVITGFDAGVMSIFTLGKGLPGTLLIMWLYSAAVISRCPPFPVKGSLPAI